MSAKPPIVGDVARVIGAYAEKVENRSLLLQKFSIHKSWPNDENGHVARWDEASRWSFIRVAENGDVILNAQEKIQRRTISGQNVEERNRRKAEANLEVLQSLGRCACRKLSDDLKRMYKTYREQELELFQNDTLRYACLLGKLCSRLAINLSDSLIPNAGICLDRLFGEPYIPGSAIKGVCRHYAWWQLRNGELTIDKFQKIFGTSKSDFKDDLENYAKNVDEGKLDYKGGIDFLAAYPLEHAGIMVDITNGHYPDYYKTGKIEDLKKEKPIPNYFPVVEEGGVFTFALALNGQVNDPTLLEDAKKLLRDALEANGIGAKTVSGYGWFDFSETERYLEKQQNEREERQNQQILENLKSRIHALDSMDANTSGFKSEIDAIKNDSKFNELPQMDRDHLAQQIKRLPQPSLIDTYRERWQNCKHEKIPEIKNFNKQSDEGKKAVVMLLREESGIGHDVWQAIRGGIKGNSDVNKAVEAIRAYCKNNLSLGKMP